MLFEVYFWIGVIIPMKLYKQEVGMLATNCYLAVNEATHEGIIVDPGADCEAIMELVTHAGVEKVVGIFLTHGHSDHIGALNEVHKATGAPVYVSEGDKEALTKADVNLYFFIGVNIECAPAENLVTDGEVIALGGMEFEVLATPGHTKGGVCYYNKENKFAFVGDTIFCESIGRTDLPGGSYKVILDSIRNKILVLDDGVTLLPGHGPQTSVGWERRRNPFLQ